jgi:hypothetical protein
VSHDLDRVRSMKFFHGSCRVTHENSQVVLCLEL